MNHNSKIFQNSIWSVTNQILSILVSFFISLFFGRIFGPAILGSYSSSQALVGLLILLTNFGIPTILSREIACKPNKINFFLSSSLSIKLILSFPLLMVLTLIVTLLLRYSQFDIMISLLTAIYLSLTSILSYLELSMKSIHRNDIFLKVNIFYKLILLLSTTLLLILRLDLITIIISQSIISFLTLVFTIKYIYPLTGRLVISYNYRVFKNIVFISSPFVLVSTAEFINLKIDSLFINQILGLAKTGYYNAAYNIYLGAIVIPLALIQVYFPNFVERNKISFLLSKSLFHKYFINLFVYSSVIGLFFYFFGDFILIFLYDKDFLESKIVLKILMSGVVIIVLNRLVNYTLVALKENRYYLRITLMGTVINILLNFYLIKYFDIKGAAFSTLLTEALILFLGLHRLYKMKLLWK